MKSIEAGATAYISKPFTIEELEKKIIASLLPAGGTPQPA